MAGTQKLFGWIVTALTVTNIRNLWKATMLKKPADAAESDDSLWSGEPAEGDLPLADRYLHEKGTP